ncbi:dihydroxyacetone kinase, C-terminal domain [Melghirimyces thermohalophilus]|uniref:phosphoenolpyruvate--glycerone phosphotransferase n=1 Tax=Melghirimyces thermohalophilus TaxID=1236220 RepID=A0A1G6J6B3_9BACL|nr:dihydroxyacetone kinase subunit DhaL [Melghirimyces thermohalophilus]SDC14402.1 dihydroxyacetone kinase, C-terminal domain [Melghirimyces thermohalophilus]
MDVTVAKAWFQRYADVISEEKALLTRLDSAIGDGDHGANMARGWKAVQEELESFTGGLSDAFLLVSRTLISKVGGASGPLYGTVFLRMSMALKGKETIDETDWSNLLQQGAEGIAQRGKVTGGEKTMYDVWSVLPQAAEETAQQGEDELTLVTRLAQIAREKADATQEMKATKGRAAYLGDRSIGHKDPGAESTALLFDALRSTLADKGGADHEN